MQNRVSHFKFFCAAEDLLTKGVNALRNNNNISAKLHLQKAIYYFSQIDNMTKKSFSRFAFAYYLLGKTYEKIGDLKSALDYYQEAITTMLRINNITNIDREMITTYEWHLNNVQSRLNNIANETIRPITKSNQA